MIRQLDSRQQRLLAIAILAVVLVAVAGLTIVPVWTATASYNGEIDRLQDRLQSLKGVAASDGNVRSRYEQIKAAQLSSGHYLTSTTDAVAAAELQRILKTVTARFGVQVPSTQILPTNIEDQFVRVVLRARLRGSLPGVVDTLHAIETSEVFLFVDNLTMSNSVDRRRIVQETSTDFDVTIEIFTYLPGES